MGVLQVLNAHKSFLENVQNLGILKKKAVVSSGLQDKPLNVVLEKWGVAVICIAKAFRTTWVSGRSESLTSLSVLYRHPNRQHLESQDISDHLKILINLDILDIQPNRQHLESQVISDHLKILTNPVILDIQPNRQKLEIQVISDHLNVLTNPDVLDIQPNRQQLERQNSSNILSTVSERTVKPGSCTRT